MFCGRGTKRKSLILEEDVENTAPVERVPTGGADNAQPAPSGGQRGKHCRDPGSDRRRWRRDPLASDQHGIANQDYHHHDEYRQADFQEDLGLSSPMSCLHLVQSGTLRKGIRTTSTEDDDSAYGCNKCAAKAKLIQNADHIQYIDPDPQSYAGRDELLYCETVPACHLEINAKGRIDRERTGHYQCIPRGEEQYDVYSGHPVSMDLYEDTRDRASAKSRGQLKVAVYVNCGLLTVHVVQARHLSNQARDRRCSAYVKVALSPDESKRTKCKTEVVSNSNHPTFDEKFSFELLDEDLRKRIYISAWHKGSMKQSSEFLGCMSFGIQHILSNKKTVDGWYYLLTEDYGKRKHLQVASHDRKAVPHPATPEPAYHQLPVLPVEPIPPIGRDIGCIEPCVFFLRRGDYGYGFTITGSNPVTVCRVETGTPGESVGLLRGDAIMRINGTHVARANTDSVARLIKNAERKMILEVERLTRPLPPGREATPVYDEHPRYPLCSTPGHMGSLPRKGHPDYHRPATLRPPPAHHPPARESRILPDSPPQNKVSIGICAALPARKTKFHGHVT